MGVTLHPLSARLGQPVTRDQLLYAARRVAAEHRPVPYSEGDVTEHAPDCDRDDDWYIRHGAGDPDLPGAPEVWAAHYGPPCTPNRAGITHMCVHDHGGDGSEWPCWEALCAAGLQELLAS